MRQKEDDERRRETGDEREEDKTRDEERGDERK